MSVCGTGTSSVCVCSRHEKCHQRDSSPCWGSHSSICYHQSLFLAYHCTAVSQRRKSAITFPYIILMSSPSSTDPSQPTWTREIWQVAPEVMQLLGNQIMIMGHIYLGFRGGFGSQAAHGFIWAGLVLECHHGGCAFCLGLPVHPCMPWVGNSTGELNPSIVCAGMAGTSRDGQRRLLHQCVMLSFLWPAGFASWFSQHEAVSSRGFFLFAFLQRR